MLQFQRGARLRGGNLLKAARCSLMEGGGQRVNCSNPHVTRHTSRVTRHTSHVTRHTSHVICHTSHVTRHTSHHTSVQPGRAFFSADRRVSDAAVTDAGGGLRLCRAASSAAAAAAADDAVAAAVAAVAAAAVAAAFSAAAASWCSEVHARIVTIMHLGNSENA
jgi:hypothetical protein